MNKLEQEDPQSPNINSIIIVLLQDHFWSHILVSSTEGRPRGADLIGRPTEIAKLYVKVFVQEQILWLRLRDGYFYIAMHDINGVQVLYCLQSLEEKLIDLG